MIVNNKFVLALEGHGRHYFFPRVGTLQSLKSSVKWHNQHYHLWKHTRYEPEPKVLKVLHEMEGKDWIAVQVGGTAQFVYERGNWIQIE